MTVPQGTHLRAQKRKGDPRRFEKVTAWPWERKVQCSRMSNGPPRIQRSSEAKPSHLLCEGKPEADESTAFANERNDLGVKSLDYFNFFRQIPPSFLNAPPGSIELHTR